MRLKERNLQGVRALEPPERSRPNLPIVSNDFKKPLRLRFGCLQSAHLDSAGFRPVDDPRGFDVLNVSSFELPIVFPRSVVILAVCRTEVFA